MKSNLLDPKILGMWVRCIRETSNWSQEAVAANSGLNVRTVQRIETGHPVNIGTRRSLARGLGYDNPEIFDDPEFAKNVHQFIDEIQKNETRDHEKQFPDHIPISATRVKN